jgi:hypothetical protein
MTDKRIKNEQWSIKHLISKIDNKDITKPKFQRKKKWNIHPKKKDFPNVYDYIKFLYNTENSVHPITFGQESTTQGIFYSNIDGNNRINAIKYFMDKPFDIFYEYLDDLFKIFDNINSENNSEIKEIFKSLSYDEIIKMKTPAKFFRQKNKRELFEEIRLEEEVIEQEVEKIQKKLMIIESDTFDSTVKINVNLFEGYNTDELCKTFEDINKYNSKLTETELLACRLHNICDFTINNKPFETELNECIKKYYKDKSNQEVLDCYEFEEANINAHDFIVGFQNLCNKKYSFIGETDVDGLSLFFKLYKAFYGSYINTFTSENINDFIEKILDSCEIFNQVVSSIFTEKINGKLFNKSCQEKIKTLKKNNMFMLLSCINGFKDKNTDRYNIIKNLEKCLLYHFMVSDLKNKDKREDFKNSDSITYRAGGGFIDNMAKQLLSDPEIISNKLTEKLFENLLCQLCNEVNNPYERKLENGNNKNDKRRTLKFFEKTIMFYFYKENIPTNMLEHEFSIEHICPNSSEWDGELDKDRVGNLIPIISTINSSRGNKHISEYSNADGGEKFIKFIKKIIPQHDIYNNIISHDKKPRIKSNKLYNNMCEKNEEEYRQNFINCLFK